MTGLVIVNPKLVIIVQKSLIETPSFLILFYCRLFEGYRRSKIQITKINFLLFKPVDFDVV